MYASEFTGWGKLVKYFNVLHLGPNADLKMDSTRKDNSVFSFLNAVRNRKPVDEVEACRKGLTNESGICTYTYSDGLKYAIMYGHAKYSDYLLQHHLEESLEETVCCPLILLAVRHDMPEIVEQLCKFSRLKLEHNFYIDRAGCSAMECGRTALHIAAETGNLTCTKILLRYGANYEKTDDFGHNPMSRILDKLRSPHIHKQTILCLIELFKCKSVVTNQDISAFNRIVDNCIINLRHTEIDSQWFDMVSGPFNLKQICRCAIRQKLTYPGLPEKLDALGLPSSLVHYLALKSFKATH